MPYLVEMSEGWVGGSIIKKFFWGRGTFFINHILYSPGPLPVFIHTISCIKYSCRELTGTLYLVPVFNKCTGVLYGLFEREQSKSKLKKG